MKNLPNLTSKESIFLTKFLSINECGAKTPGDLLEDNFSCQTLRDLRELGYNKNEVAGYISSLEEKNVLMIEDGRGPENPFIKIKGRKQKMLPDLYWVTGDYLETLDSNWNFIEEA